MKSPRRVLTHPSSATSGETAQQVAFYVFRESSKYLYLKIVAIIGVNRHAVRAPVVDLEEPEGKSKWGFVSGYETGLRHRHDSLPKSKESQIRALEEGRHQHSSSLPY